jgi:hypothetical protein
MDTNRQNLYLAEFDTKGAILTKRSELITDTRKARGIIWRSNAQKKSNINGQINLCDDASKLKMKNVINSME